MKLFAGRFIRACRCSFTSRFSSLSGAVPFLNGKALLPWRSSPFSRAFLLHLFVPALIGCIMIGDRRHNFRQAEQLQYTVVCFFDSGPL